MNYILFLISFLFCLTVCYSFSADEVTQLPGLTKNLTFRQYSGYLTVGKGRYMHYWFVESQSKPETDPLILWLTGGPGCSSLIAFLSENGPFRVQSDSKTVAEDPYSWNRLANVLYLESPVGVGYSYDTNQSQFEINDNTTAEDNYSALQQFFVKFPQFKNHSFYITGESYGGIYVPMLAHKIYEKNSTINLKGVAVGNGALDLNLISESRVRFAYTHGLIESNQWNDLVNNCCHCDGTGQQVCNFSDEKSTNCHVLEKIRDIVDKNGINVYNIYSDCPPIGVYSEISPYFKHLKTYLGFNTTQLNGLAQVYSTNRQCVDYPAYIRYLNSNDTRKALHVSDQVKNWTQCSDYIDEKYKMQYKSMKVFVKDLIEKFKIPKFIVYNGDLDLVCDFLSGQQFVDGLGYKLIDKYKKWSIDGRTAGFLKRYEGISFFTVRNAGHMVPTDQPEAGLAIIKELIGVSKIV